MLALSGAYNIFLFKAIIMFVLATCLVITSDHHSLHQHNILSILRKLQSRSRVGEGLLPETQHGQLKLWNGSTSRKIFVVLANISSKSEIFHMINCKRECPHLNGFYPQRKEQHLQEVVVRTKRESCAQNTSIHPIFVAWH